MSCAVRRGGEANVSVPACAGHGDGQRSGLDGVRDFGQSDKVIGPKGVVEGVEGSVAKFDFWG
jgi:hypothetical protein